MSGARNGPAENSFFGDSERSSVCRKVSAVTGWSDGGGKRKPRRIRRVHVRPPSETTGCAAGISGGSRAPAVPEASGYRSRFEQVAYMNWATEPFPPIGSGSTAVSVGLETRSTCPLIGGSGLGAAAAAIQIRPAWYAADVGSAVLSSSARFPDTWSSDETALAAVSATQSLPPPKEICSGSEPAAGVLWTPRSSSLSRKTSPPGLIAAHSEPPPPPTPLSQPCSFCGATTRLAAGPIFP